MKNVIVVACALALSGCPGPSGRISEPFPNHLTRDIDWITYEGILPSGNGHIVLTELKLVPGTPGMDSYYNIVETLHVPDSARPFSMSTRSHGKYAVLFGSPHHNIIHITNKTRMRSIIKGKRFEKGDEVTDDLYLKSYGDHELVLVDEDFQDVIPRYTLIRRSELFTVEGYLTVYGDTAEFFEKNTRKGWPVAQLARYAEAAKKYELLAKEKFEGVYLKALSYSISHRDRDGNESDALVFKEILHMDSTSRIQ